jgi:cobalt-zinc-cadmium efflux system outer membrane protein
MNGLAKAIPVAVAIAVAGANALCAQTLRQAVEAAWAINPEIASLAARREAIASRRVTAQSWFAGAPFVTLGHVTDQVIVNKRQRATEGEVAVPLWLPGEGTATEQVVDAELLRTDAQVAEAKLKVAGEVRDALYTVALAEGEVKLADQRVSTARELEADVARRAHGGEAAELEHDLVRGELLDAEAKARERRAELATAQVNLRSLTGLSVPAASLNEPLAMGQDLDAHPRLQAATRGIQAAQAALRLAIIANRDSPEIGVVAGRNRDIRGTEYDTTVGLRLKVPFATEGRNAPRRAAAQAEVLAAQAEYAGTRRQIEAELASARQTLAAAQDQTPLIEARLQAVRQAVARLRRAYDAGEIGLTELLRARSTLYDAEAASIVNRLGVARARARVNQAAGLVP